MSNKTNGILSDRSFCRLSLYWNKMTLLKSDWNPRLSDKKIDFISQFEIDTKKIVRKEEVHLDWTYSIIVKV